MAIKYIPPTKRDVRNFRRERAVKELNRGTIIEESYIRLRKLHLQIRKNNPALEQVAANFNSYVRNTKHSTTMDVFHYFIANIV